MTPPPRGTRNIEGAPRSQPCSRMQVRYRTAASLRARNDDAVTVCGRRGANAGSAVVRSRALRQWETAWGDTNGDRWHLL
jgi:hypothetical protein